MMQDPTTQVQLIPGHAGRGRGGVRPKLICVHVQQGYNDLYQEFLNRPADNQADCTIWSKQDGTLVRLLKDSDTPWTNGDVSAPDMTNPIIGGMVLAGVTNTNAYSYTIEHQGFADRGFNNAQVEATARMCAYWCYINGWEPSRDRIVGHYQVGNHKNCPGPLFPFARVVTRAKEILDSEGSSHVSDSTTPPKLYEANPQGFSIGPGVMEVLNNEGMVALTNEDYYVADGNKPGLPKRSFTYASRMGITYRVEATQDLDSNNQPLPTWSRQIWRFEKEIK